MLQRQILSSRWLAMSEMKPEQFGYIFIHVLRLGPRYKDEYADPVPTSDWDSPPLSGRAEENDETEKKGEDNLTDDREEEDDARSSCFSREDSCDTGEAKVLHPNIKKKKIVHTALRPDSIRHTRALSFDRFPRRSCLSHPPKKRNAGVCLEVLGLV